MLSREDKKKQKIPKKEKSFQFTHSKKETQKNPRSHLYNIVEINLILYLHLHLSNQTCFYFVYI